MSIVCGGYIAKVIVPTKSEGLQPRACFGMATASKEGSDKQYILSSLELIASIIVVIVM